jgi:hypothetical protein
MTTGIRHIYEFVKSEFEKEGYILLSTEYINNRLPLYFRCPNGHEYFINWANWNSGFRCAKCARNVKFTIEEVRALFEAESYKLLADFYKNQRQKLEYVCPSGHKNSITLSDWKYGGYRCPTCHQINMSGPGNHQWKGGVSYEPYCEIWKDKEYKNDIKERDGNKCMNPCCDSKHPDDLTIHHVDYIKKNCSPKNLITLCRVCNIKANKDRRWHKAWYQAILHKRYNFIY